MGLNLLVPSSLNPTEWTLPSKPNPSCPCHNYDAARIFYSHMALLPLPLIPRMPCKRVLSLYFLSSRPRPSSLLIGSFLKRLLCSLSTHRAAEFGLLSLVFEVDLLSVCFVTLSYDQPQEASTLSFQYLPIASLLKHAFNAFGGHSTSKL